AGLPQAPSPPGDDGLLGPVGCHESDRSHGALFASRAAQLIRRRKNPAPGRRQQDMSETADARPVHLVTPDEQPQPAIDLDAAEGAATGLLRAIGADLDAPGVRDTPRRMATAYAELLTPAPFRATTFPAEGYDELVVVRAIPFHSLCEHHLLPFHG